jgi:hypothetical protein
MPLTHTRVTEVAVECKEICDDLKQTYYRLKEFLDTNSDLAIDWAGDPLPGYINEDANENLDGLKFSRAQVANAVGSLDNFRKLLENLAADQGDHLGNLNQLANV